MSNHYGWDNQGRLLRNRQIRLMERRNWRVEFNTYDRYSRINYTKYYRTQWGARWSAWWTLLFRPADSTAWLYERKR